MIRSASVFVAFLMALVVASARQPADPLVKFNGAWVAQGGGTNSTTVADVRVAGLPVPQRGEPRVASLKLDAGKWALTGGKKDFAGTVTATAGEPYHQIDFLIEKDGKAGGKMLGLILDYKNGTWMLAVNLPDRPRPETPEKAELRYVWKADKAAK